MNATAQSAPFVFQAKSEDHRKSLERLFQRIGQLSSLPAVAQRILNVAENDESNATDLLGVVGQDPTLAIRILRIVNSSLFGVPNKVGDLQTAIAMLGFVEVRNLALTVYVARLCEGSSKFRSFSREALWQHMVAVGAIAREIAKINQRVEPEEAYMTGLLHDVGMMMIDQYMHGPFCKVIDMVSDGAETTLSERQILSFDHADLGAYVASKSHFPERVFIAIQHHHRPDEYQGPERELLDIVVMANYFASQRGFTSLGVDNKTPEPSKSKYDALGLHERQLTSIIDDLDSVLKSAKVLSNI